MKETNIPIQSFFIFISALMGFVGYKVLIHAQGNSAPLLFGIIWISFSVVYLCISLFLKKLLLDLDLGIKILYIIIACTV
jgi:hypothetical protein